MLSPNARILFVDDDQDTREMMELLFYHTNHAYQVTSASNAEEAIDLIEKGAFDFYILDLLLTNFSGTELCRKIRLSDRHTPIVFYSGMGRKIDREQAIEAGATHYFVKPNDLDLLIKATDDYLTNLLAPGSLSAAE